MDKREMLTTYRAAKVWTACERIMSDVWANIRYAALITPEGYRTVAVENDEFPSKDPLPKPTMADDAEQALYEAWRRAKANAARERRLKEEAAREARTVRKGKTVKVVKGRKVPRGTVGKVIWVGDGRWGKRVGLATSDLRDDRGWHVDVEWTALSNVEVVADEDGHPVAA
jgi:hypothetical protein